MADAGLLSPLRERDFTRLWVGQAVSNVGDWVNYVALTALIWNLTESAWMVAVLRACHAVPYLLLGPVSGVFVDRWNRKTTMVVVDLLRAGLVLLFPLVRDVSAILAITLAFNVASIFFGPAKNALIPRTVARDRLLAANSLSSTTQNMAMVLGPAMGGIILASAGTAAAFYFDSVSFLLSAAAIATMSVSGKPERGSLHRVDAREELVQGLRFAATRPPVRSALLLEVGMMMGWGSVNVLAIVIAEKVLAGGPTEYGLLLTAVGIGSLVGAVATGAAGARLGTVRVFPLGFVLTGVGIAGLAGSHTLRLAWASYFVVGVGRTMIEVAATTTYQRTVPDSLRGRVFSLRHTVTHLVILLSNQMAGAFTDAAVLAPLLITVAALQLGGAALSAMLLSRPGPWHSGGSSRGPID